VWKWLEALYHDLVPAYMKEEDVSKTADYSLDPILDPAETYEYNDEIV
jgi:hypothetical protein